MATFTIGGGNQGNISPFLTGKATPMSLPPGYLAESGRQAAALQKGIAGVGADIGKALVARAKEEERSEGYDVLIEALEKRAQQSGEFPATQIKSPLASPPELPDPELDGDLSSLLVESDVAPHMRLSLVTPREDWGSVTTETQPGDALAGILGGDVAEKYRSGKMRSSQKEAIVKAMMGWEANMFGKTRRQLDDLLLDKALREEADRKAFSKTSQAVLQDRMIPEQTVTEITEKTISPQAINAMQVKLANQEPLDDAEFKVMMRLAQDADLGRQDALGFRVPEGIKARTLEEQGARREDINLIWEWLGQPPLENYSPSVQAGVAKVYDELPEGMMAKAKSLGQARGAGYKEAVKKRLADHVRESGENSPAPYTRTKEEIEKWNLMRGRKPVPKSERETAVEMELRKNEAEYIALTSTPYSTATGKRYEERIRKLKRELGGLRNKREAGRVIRDREGNPIVPQFRPPEGEKGTASENILSEAVTPESISRMKPEDQALFTDMVEPLYTGGERVIGTEEVERVIPGREKSPTELRGEIRDALMAGDNWTPDTKKKLDELMPGVTELQALGVPGTDLIQVYEVKDGVRSKLGTPQKRSSSDLREFKVDVLGPTAVTRDKTRADKLRQGISDIKFVDNSVRRLLEISKSEGTEEVNIKLRGEAKALQQTLIGRLRVALLGPGVMTEKDAERIIAAIPDPTAIFALDTAQEAALTTTLKSIRRGLVNDIETHIEGGLGNVVLPDWLQGAGSTRGAAGGTSGKFSFQGGELKLNK